jgi:pyruvate formate lyase activating enzyme
MATAHEAWFWEPLPNGRVHCALCPHDCRIANGSRGACAVRFNDGGTLRSVVYDTVVDHGVEPIEKKPLFHFFPGSSAYSIATVGCHLQCTYCQNWHISQWPRTHLPRRLERADTIASLDLLAQMIPGRRLTPRQIVAEAKEQGAAAIAYTFTDPTIFYELTYDTAVLARAAGLSNVLVTSAFISEAPLRKLVPVIDAANIDLKFFRDESYRRISRARLQPVLEAIRLLHDLGVWIEITTLVVPEVNDTAEELGRIAGFIRSLGRDVPWHVSQFYPTYKMLDRPCTPVETLRRAREIGLAAGLKYVYEGNVPGERGEHTICAECGTVLIERFGVALRLNRIRDGRCPACATTVEGVGMDGTTRRMAVAAS